MKKFYYLSMAALALMATACSSDETVEMSPSSKQAIGFSTFVDKATRSYDGSYSNANKPDFLVYGWMEKNSSATQIFKDQKVDKDGNYSPVQYWAAGYKYYFGAVAPQDVTSTAELASDNSKITYTVSNYINDSEKDLCFAHMVKKDLSSETTVNASVSKVQLTFSHALARVKFSFVNEFGGGTEQATFKVSNVQITNAYKTGTASYEGATVDARATWSSQSDETLTISFGNVVAKAETESETTAAGDAVSIPYYISDTSNTDYNTYKDNVDGLETGYARLLIPSGDTKSYTVTFHVEYAIGNEKIIDKDLTATINAESATTKTELQAGYSYDFKAVLNKGNVANELIPIEFEISAVTDWQEWTNVDVPQDAR